MTQKRHKDFSVGPRNTEPLSFSLEGHHFNAKGQIPGATLLDFVKQVDGSGGGTAAGVLVDFIVQSVVPSEKDKFLELIHDENVSIPIETLGALCEWLVQEYTSRPTQLPSTSLDGQTQSGSGSTERASAQD